MKPNLTVIILLRALRWLGCVAYWARACREEPADKIAQRQRYWTIKWARAGFQFYHLRTNHERRLLPLTAEDIFTERRAA